MNIDSVILANLLQDESFTRQVLPFLKEEYFNGSEKLVFRLISIFVTKYNSIPSKEALNIELAQVDSLNENQFKNVQIFLDELKADHSTDRKFLLDETEKFAKDRALFNALNNSIAIYDDKEKGDKGSIPKLLQDALAVSFDSSVGHDFFDDADKRFAEYHSIKNRLAFDLDIFNTITDGGLLSKTLTVFLASTGGGKSLAMVHLASSYLQQGKNVIYFTMEMSEQQIAQRIDHNILSVPKHELMDMSQETYTKRLARIREKSKGKLIVKEFPSGGASAAHFRYIINDLRLKRNFVPDVIFVDYLNICSSSRIKMGGSINTYVLVKSIAEEIRGLAQEFDVPVITATQTNRDGMNNSDVDLTNTSESVGIPQTADYMFALINSEELEQLGQIMVKQLKNRYGDPTKYRKFVIGIDRSRMKLFNTENEAQEDISQPDKPVMDSTTFGQEDAERKKPGNKFNHNKFRGFQ